MIATGRHLNELSRMPVKGISFDAYITLNGQLCLDSQGKVIFGNPITGKSKESIIQMFKDKTIPIMLVEKERMRNPTQSTAVSRPLHHKKRREHHVYSLRFL